MQNLYDKNYSRASGEKGWIRKMTMKQRFHYIDREIASLKKKRILDLGCAGGGLLKFLKNRSRRVWGADINHHMLRKTDAGSGLVCCDAARLPFPSRFFDIIVCSHMIEHVPSVSRCLREISRISRPGSRQIIIYPMELFRGASCIPDVLSAGQPIHTIRDIHLHKLSFSRLRRFIRGSGLEIVRNRIIFALLPMYMTVLEKPA